jgi:hypothetical protein
VTDMIHDSRKWRSVPQTADKQSVCVRLPSGLWVRVFWSPWPGFTNHQMRDSASGTLRESQKTKVESRQSPSRSAVTTSPGSVPAQYTVQPQYTVQRR